MTLHRQDAVGIAPGLGLVAVGTAFAMSVHAGVHALSPLLVAIVLGAVCANLADLPAATAPGIKVASTTVLRIGVALLGLHLVLGDIIGLGAGMIAVVVAIVAGGVLGTLAIGRALGVPFAQRLLIACGTSICGAAAVAAVDGVIDADEEDVAAAVGSVVVFGTAMIAVIPFASGLLGLTSTESGQWAGGAIHEVAQVVATGGVLGGGALAAAVVVKLARVLMLAPVLAVISVRQRRLIGHAGRRPPIVPVFVIGFAACVALRSTGAVPDAVVAAGQQVQVVALTAAMFALGAGIRLQALRRLGLRPFVLAASGTVLVAGTALAGVAIAG